LHRTATRAALGFGAIIKNDAKHKQEQLTRKKEEAVSRPRFDVFVVCVVLFHRLRLLRCKRGRCRTVTVCQAVNARSHQLWVPISLGSRVKGNANGMV